jgi:metal-dependent amidase/aminoacylase/carboxypeptidase family protein
VIAAVRQPKGDVINQGEDTMAAEDLAEFAAVAPSFQLRIGSGQPGRDDRLHNAFYQPDERSIGLGVQALSRAALDLLA